MANVQHASLTGAELHEPKGAAAASAGEVYEATGGGTGTWLSRAPRGWLSGMTLANNATDGDHDLDITAGIARASDDSITIQTTSTITKRIDASWASGTGNGGLSSSLTLSSNTWYHVFAILVGGSADFGFDTSATAANLITDHSATVYRRIGSVKTNSSSNILDFYQWGDWFYWDSPILDQSAVSIVTTGNNLSLSVPLGIRTMSRFNARIAVDSVGVYFSPVDIPHVAAATGGAPLIALGYNDIAPNTTSGMFDVLTNTNSQIRAASTASTSNSFYLATLGWMDERGRAL